VNLHGRDSSWLAVVRMPGSQWPPTLELLETPTDESPSMTRGSGHCILFDGVLYDRGALREQLAGRLPVDPTDADLLAQAYDRWGEDLVGRLRGIFALIVTDDARDLVLCARDPLGIRPLFYAEVGQTLLVSPSVETLLRHPGVSTELNRASLVARLTKRWPAMDETYFRHVRRVLPGHVLRVRGADRRVSRYWNPVPVDGPAAWIPDDEAPARFETALERAVARCLDGGPAGIYMSGGLDSSMLAMVAADLCRDQGLNPPRGLSLLFSADRAEAAVQQGVTAALGLPQRQVLFEEAAGPEGTLGAALAMTRALPAPLALMWRPALQHLAAIGREHGCRVILAGDGADEWLWVNPILAADLLGSLDLPDLYRLWRTYSRSYHFSGRQAFRIVVWHYGIKQLVPDAYRAAAVRLGAARLVRRRRRALAMRNAGSPPWITPDPALRAEMLERLEAAYARKAAGPKNESYYLRDTRSRLDAPETWLREEETFLVGRRTGVPVREPFWDPDLIELLVRVRPAARSADGLAKSLVRRPLTGRFPGLGFERQRKSNLGAALLSVLETQARSARQAMGELRALVDLGVIDGDQVRVLMDDALAGRSHRYRLGWVWEFLNLEAWTRAHR
jgi:asparagine synthase (glutamine-hydrolysing)